MKNWKTTLLGVLGGIAMFFGQAASERAVNPQAPPITAGNILPSLAIVALGAVAKDHNVTGGTKQQ